MLKKTINFSYPVVLCLAIIFVLNFYLWTASYGYKFSYLYADKNPNTHTYTRLTDAFFHGQLHFRELPKKELLELPNPYDPNLNQHLRIHDASLYRGKYYLYFGPTPVIVLMLPFRILKDAFLPDSFAVFLFSAGAFIFSVLILLFLYKNYFQNIKKWAVILSVLILGFGNGALWLMKRPDMYEVAISCGMFFLTGALFFMMKAFEGESKNIFFLILSSLFFGLAVGGRPHYVFSGILLLISVLKYVKYKKKYIEQITSGIIILMPFSLCILLLLIYNYLRFGNIVEFGGKYQLTGFDLNMFPEYSLEYIPSGIYSLFFTLPKYTSDFPYIFLQIPTPPKWLFVPDYYFVEILSGIFPANPFLLLFVLTPITFLISSSKKDNLKNKFPFFESSTIFLSGFFSLFILLIRPYANFRYLADFSIQFILLTIIIWFYFYLKIKDTKLKIGLNILTVIFALYSMFAGCAFSFNEYFGNGIISANPQEYEKFKSYFTFIESIIIFFQGFFL